MQIKGYKIKDHNYILPENSEFLFGFKKINIFVGANNSGKSRFLRNIFIAKQDDFVFIDNREEIKKITQVYEKLQKRLQNRFAMNDLKELLDVKTGDYYAKFNYFIQQINKRLTDGGGYTSQGGVSGIDVARSIQNEMSVGGLLSEKPVVNIDNLNVYIPILRGLRYLNGAQEDLYKNKTNNDYKIIEEKDKNKEMFTGLSVYEEIKRMLLGKREEREFIKAFEKFLSENFFNNSDITIIPDYDTIDLKININNGKEDRKIFDVGDGIQSIIINTFPAFKYQKKDLIMFIEEPEMTMHPSIQRILLETLTKKFDKLQIFLTTHSNHFLDLSYDYPDDVAIYSFESKGDDKFLVRNVGDNSKILDLLGIRNSSVFLSNCVIWTEGVTDRMLIKKLIELKGSEYKEDYNYAFVEYGGSNLENFDFIGERGFQSVAVETISRHNFIIADNDNIKGDKKSDLTRVKYKRRKKIESVIGEKNFFDKHIEIENLIPFKVWVKAIQKMLVVKPGKTIKIKDNVADFELEFNKNLNNKKIGTLIKDYIVDSLEETSSNYFKSDGIKCLGEDKKETMGFVVEAIDELGITFEDFPQLARDLVGTIEEFIKLSNTTSWK